jgi:hypothetical protein
MKTKSVVRPSEIQRTALNLERPELGASRVEDAMICLLGDRRNEGRDRRERYEKVDMDSFT